MADAPGAADGASTDAPGAADGASTDSPGAPDGASTDSPGAPDGSSTDATGTAEGASTDAPGAAEGASTVVTGATDGASTNATADAEPPPAEEPPTVEKPDFGVGAGAGAASDADSPKKAAASPRKGAGARKPDEKRDAGNRRSSKERAGEAPARPNRRTSKERAGEAEAEGVELPEVTAVQVANDGKMAREMQLLLKDLEKKKNWVVRATALRKLQGLVLGGAVGQFPAFLKALKSSEFSNATKDLFAELRSQLVKEVCDTVLALLKGVLDASAHKEYDQYFTDIVLVEAFRTVCKANTTIVASADACLQGLVRGFHSLRMLRGVVEPMADPMANSRLRLQCAQLLTIILESWSSDKLNKGAIEINNRVVDALEAIENGILKSLSDSKSETRVAAKACHDKFAELFPQRAPRLLERMNRQQLRIVREGEPEADGDDKEDGGAHKRKAHKHSLSPERNLAQPTHHPVSQAERQKRKRDKDLAERARARGVAKGEGQEVDPAEALVLCQGELAGVKDKLENVERQLAEEKRKSKNLHKLKEEAIKSRDQEKQALESVLQAQSAAVASGASEAGKEAARNELQEKVKELQQQLKKEQARARKMMEERDEWQRIAKNAQEALAEGGKGSGKDEQKEDKADKRGRRAKRDVSHDARAAEEGGEVEKKAAKPEKKPEEKKEEKKSVRQQKNEEKEKAEAAALADVIKQLEGKNKKLVDKMKSVTEGMGLLEEEKKLLEEKIAELEMQQDRAKVELDMKAGELRQVKERWQVRERDWFEARMSLERAVEALKAELMQKNGKAEKWSEERQQLLKRFDDLKARLGENEDRIERDEYSESNLVRRKVERDGRGQTEEQESEAAGESELRQLRMELEEKRQLLLRQEVVVAEARATASMAQQELQHWRQRVQDMEPERNRASHMADKLRAELEWRGRVQGQEERRLRAHAQHAEEGRRRVEAQLAHILKELQVGQTEIAERRVAPESIMNKISHMISEEASRIKMHRYGDVYLSADMGMQHPMFAHHAVAPPLFAPSAPPNHGFVGVRDPTRGVAPGGGGGGRGAGPKDALPWAAFDVELGKDLRLPAIGLAQGGGGRGQGGGGEGGGVQADKGSPLKKRNVRPSNAGR